MGTRARETKRRIVIVGVGEGTFANRLFEKFQLEACIFSKGGSPVSLARSTVAGEIGGRLRYRGAETRPTGLQEGSRYGAFDGCVRYQCSAISLPVQNQTRSCLRA